MHNNEHILEHQDCLEVRGQDIAHALMMHHFQHFLSQTLVSDLHLISLSLQSLTDAFCR